MAAKREYLHPASALLVVPAWNLVALARCGCEACSIHGSKPGGSDDAMNDETIRLPKFSEPGSSAMPSSKNIVKRTGSWRRSGEPRSGFVALFVHSYCCAHDYMRMFHNNTGFLVLQIIFAGRFTRFRAGLPTLVLRVWDGWNQHGRVEVWHCGRCCTGAVLRGYRILVLKVFRTEDSICDLFV
jgi:hypothetical protein